MKQRMNQGRKKYSCTYEQVVLDHQNNYRNYESGRIIQKTENTSGT